MAQLYAAGVKVDWAALDRPYRRKRVHLPAYPFQRERYWVESAAPAPPRAEPAPLTGLYASSWRPQGEVDASALRAPAAAGRWVVLLDRSGVGERLAAALEAAGGRCERVERGDAFARLGDARWRVDPGAEQDLRQLCASLRAEGGALRGVVHLWSFDAQTQLDPDGRPHLDLRAAQHLGPLSVLHLVRGLLAGGGAEQSLALWLVTRGAAATSTEAAPVEVAGAPLWGLGSVLALEHPTLWGGLVDLPCASSGQALDAEARVLAAVLCAPLGEERLALREASEPSALPGLYRRYVQRIAPLTLSPSEPSAASGEGTYLITGGLGALGMHTARWLVDRGARHLALLSRRGPASPDAVGAVAELERRGARTVRVLCADVASPDAMRGALAVITETMPPLVGVFHAAGVEAPQALTAIDARALDQVMEAKVAGAWNLHALTRGAPLQVFACFSSISSVWGSAGQGAYAAANAFLDALVHHRRAQGLPALSVNWGPWSGGGMASAEDLAVLARMGIGALQPASALSSLAALIDAGAAQAVVADMNWPVFRAVYEARRERALLAEIGDRSPGPPRPAAPGSAAPASPWAERLQSARAGERTKLLQAWLSEEVAKVLGFKDGASAVGVRRGFFDMGMDSLMAVELRNRVQAQL
ncbi:MAG TPA: SDR family NAD(P)-dependent oxidoreductase, partial [Bacilli bacterium]|nr:SDR family NAD(P)-dependent oxidoreductase [Bacilli bacterium]